MNNQGDIYAGSLAKNFVLTYLLIRLIRYQQWDKAIINEQVNCGEHFIYEVNASVQALQYQLLSNVRRGFIILLNERHT